MADMFKCYMLTLTPRGVKATLFEECSVNQGIDTIFNKINEYELDEKGIQYVIYRGDRIVMVELNNKTDE